MIVDRFTKFILSVIAFSLCLIALNPWISPTLANAGIEDGEIKTAIEQIASGINKIANSIETQIKYNSKCSQITPRLAIRDNADAEALERSKANRD